MLAAALAFVLPLGSPAALANAFPEIAVSKATATLEWPFSVDEGTLTCVELRGQRTVIFSENWREDVPQEFGNMTLPRSVIVSANPFAVLASLEDRALYLPWDTLETLIRRLGPWEAMGKTLCDTPSDPPAEDL